MTSSPSSPPVASSDEPRCVVDTVVLRYFLVVDQFDLLVELLGAPLGIPRIVFDPDEEPDTPDDARSELTRSISYQRKVGRDPARDPRARADAALHVERLRAIKGEHQAGRVVVLDLDDEERALFARLTSPQTCKDLGLRFPLDPGEAACLAFAVSRALVLATDDADALKALEHRRAGHPYERIRRLLIRAAESGLCASEQANEIHAEMRRAGFWDREEPFPA